MPILSCECRSPELVDDGSAGSGLAGARPSGHGRWPALALVTVAMLPRACDESATERRSGCLADDGRDHDLDAPLRRRRPTRRSPRDATPLEVVAHATRPAAGSPRSRRPTWSRAAARPVSPAGAGGRARPRGRGRRTAERGRAHRGRRHGWTALDPVRDREGATTLVVTGDVMLVRGVPDPAAALAPMRRLLRGADLTVGNLESTLSTDGEPPQPGRRLVRRQPGAGAGRWRTPGFDALSLANNHTGDYGEPRAASRPWTPCAAAGSGRSVRATTWPRRRGRRCSRRRTGRRSPSSASTRSARPRGRRDAARARCRSGCRRAPGRWSRPTSTASSAPSARRRRRADVVVVLPHWGDAVHAHPRAGPAHGRPAAGRGRRRPGRRRPPALGAGRRRGRRRAGAALARQLRLRHGLHASQTRPWRASSSRRRSGAPS